MTFGVVLVSFVYDSVLTLQVHSFEPFEREPVGVLKGLFNVEAPVALR